MSERVSMGCSRRAFRGRASAGVFVGACSVMLALWASSPAQAEPIHAFATSFGTEGAGAGQFTAPAGIAVNEVTLGSTGNVYVVDEGNARVEIFSSEGKGLKGEFNGEETPAGGFASPNAIAIDNSADSLDPSAGDVYVVDSGHSVIDKFDPEGNYLGQIATGAGGEPLGELLGVAVDPAGVVWVYQASKELDSYSNASVNVFLSSAETPFEEAIPGFAVDSEDNLYVNKGRFGKISSSGERLIKALGPEEATAAAIDPSDDHLYIDTGEGISAFETTEPVGCTPAKGETFQDSQCVIPLEQFGGGHLSASHGVTVDSQNDLVYASNRETDTVAVFDLVHTPTALTGEATNLSESTATLNGTVNPEGVEVSTCAFEYGHSSEYGESVPCEQEPGSGEGAVPVSANISGLEVGRYHFRITASNANGETHGADHTFAITAKPTISAEGLLSVGATSATISAQINPNGLPTTYQLEYGTSTGYGSVTATGTLGPAFSFAGVQINITGLSPSIVYHARVFAANARGSVKGTQDITITAASAGGSASASSCSNRTFAGFSPLLPDCRAYELVSGDGGPGEVYVPAGPATISPHEEDVTTELAMRAAAGGGRAAYVGEPGETGGSGSSGKGLGNQFLATRDAGSWSVQNVTPSVAEAEVIPNSPIFEGFSAELETGVFSSDSTALAKAASPQGPGGCQVLYNRSSDGAFHALFAQTLTPGECGKPTPPEAFLPQNLVYAGANEGTPSMPAGSHMLFQSPAPLAANASASVEESEGSNLYESIGGVARLVSVLPGGEADADAVFGARPSTPLNRPNFTNVISADGAQIFWTDLSSGRLYERLNGTSTVAVSQGVATYWGASTDGHFAFYSEGEELWRFDTQSDEREEFAGEGAGVQGVAGISEDGSYVYFVASGALAVGAESRKCQEPGIERIEKQKKGELTPEDEEQLLAEAHEEQRGRLPAGRGCNLYLHHSQETKLVAALSVRDDDLRRIRAGEALELGAWQGELGARTAEVSDGGRELVFESTQQLTGYDNSRLDEAINFEYGVEAFVYNMDTGLACASCEPSGAPPALEPGGSGTFLPISLSPTFMRRWVSADGSKVFFDTSQPLSKQDTNGTQDVYEWERAGSGTCLVGSAGGGCITLLSGGDSADLSFFVDASADGGDVFFTHRGLLDGVGNKHGRAALFDVRAGGGFPESSTACTGTGCQGVPPAPPSFATPPSTTFSGGGNFSPIAKSKPPPKLTRAQLLAKALRACKTKKLKRKRISCEKQAHKRYGSVKAKGKQGRKGSAKGGKQARRGEPSLRSSSRGRGQ
jgi:hypothetical protein